MCWAIRHLIPEKELATKGGHVETEKWEIKRRFWFKYTKTMRMMDKKSEVTPLSNLSPGALQRLWENKVAPNCLKLTKEVYNLNKKKRKLDVVKANKGKFTIP